MFESFDKVRRPLLPSWLTLDRFDKPIVKTQTSYDTRRLTPASYRVSPAPLKAATFHAVTPARTSSSVGIGLPNIGSNISDNEISGRPNSNEYMIF